MSHRTWYQDMSGWLSAYAFLYMVFSTIPKSTSILETLLISTYELAQVIYYHYYNSCYDCSQSLVYIFITGSRRQTRVLFNLHSSEL